ncbi:uncharacterized protein LOC113366194 [Ctenocephalides felis]|uniref:uncharacterized protein LOC113366194 n=1 Tax=Ctenocephalides felis TaxID=7515 RepID=UPI000E6E4B3E|nr:uncharacterized protein LOC113366194 [Ctenocephalides felis]
MRKRLMQAFNGCNNPRQYNNGNNRESINLVENISTLTRDDGVRYDTILENDVYDYSQQNDQEDELEHKCVFEVEDESELDQPEEREVNFDEQVYENAPITERKKRENTLLLGLWYGDKKPNMNYFFHVFYDDLKKLVNGIEVYIPCRRINITVKGILLLGTCDLPARSMNFTLETGGNVHVYPYTNNIEKRTLQNCRSFADNASRDAPIMGIKGPTALSLIMPDYVMGMAIDRMHCVEGGVTVYRILDHCGYILVSNMRI